MPTNVNLSVAIPVIPMSMKFICLASTQYFLKLYRRKNQPQAKGDEGGRSMLNFGRVGGGSGKIACNIDCGGRGCTLAPPPGSAYELHNVKN
jgi:hypothetical protein